MDEQPLTRRRLLNTAGLLTLGALVSGCGGSDDDAKVRPAPDADVVIDMRDIKFLPAAASAKVGDKVVWTNNDNVPHTVTKRGGPGPRFDSGTIPVGGTYDLVVRQPGGIDYVCTIHPNQTGTLTVR